MSPVVGVVMGSDSDLPTMQLANDMLQRFSIPHEVRILSVHRTPDAAQRYARSAGKRGIKVIIAGAGGAAHLPGLMASWTSIPIIGVPIKSTALQGLDSLLSIVQMPTGISVATMAIDGAANAGLYAAQMLGIHDDKLREKIEAYRKGLARSVRAKDKQLTRIGSAAYLAELKKQQRK